METLQLTWVVLLLEVMLMESGMIVAMMQQGFMLIELTIVLILI